MSQVLDSGVLLEFFEDGNAADEVEALLLRTEKARRRVWITQLTWAELYYRALTKSRETAEHVAREMKMLPIEVCEEDRDFSLSREAMAVRLIFKGEKIGVAYSVALARIKRAELWTCDKTLEAIPNLKIRIVGRK